jgi:two-component system, LuxR family, sensor kinase FixL
MPTQTPTTARRAAVSLLTEDRPLARSIEAALAPTSESNDHVPFDLRAPRAPFDVAAALDADCLLVDAHLPNADRLYNQWRQVDPDERPALFVLTHQSDAVPAATPKEIDGVVPAEAVTLLRRLVETVVDNRRLHDEVADLSRFAALGRTLVGVLHELKNPLSNILGALDRVRSLMPPDEQLSRWNGIIERNGALLREALADLLDGFRFNLEPKPVALHPLLDRAVAYAIAADVNVRGRIAVEKQFAQKAPIVVGNAGQLLHVFLNILVNSRQAIGDRQGAILVRSKWIEDGRIEIEISDNGPGIADDVLPHLFKNRRTTKRTGSGFGLALVHEVVVKHGGTIDACNATNGGACFRIRLPAQIE